MSLFFSDPALQGSHFPSIGVRPSEACSNLLTEDQETRDRWNELLRSRALRQQMHFVADFRSHLNEVASNEQEAGPTKGDTVFDEDQQEYVYFNVWITDRNGVLKQKPVKEDAMRRHQQRLTQEDGLEPL